MSPTEPTETCKRTAEITVPLAEVEAETEKVVAEYIAWTESASR